MPLLKGPARGAVRGDGFHFKAVVPRRQSKRIIGSSEIHSSDFVSPKDFARSFIQTAITVAFDAWSERSATLAIILLCVHCRNSAFGIKSHNGISRYQGNPEVERPRPD